MGDFTEEQREHLGRAAHAACPQHAPWEALYPAVREAFIRQGVAVAMVARGIDAVEREATAEGCLVQLPADERRDVGATREVAFPVLPMPDAKEDDDYEPTAEERAFAEAHVKKKRCKSGLWQVWFEITDDLCHVFDSYSGPRAEERAELARASMAHVLADALALFRSRGGIGRTLEPKGGE